MIELWNKNGGPWPYGEGPNGEDLAATWAYTLARGAAQRDVRVELMSSAALAAHLPAECRQAIHSEGWTAIIPHLRDDEPPARIVISTTGITAAERAL
jgi:hypothetical protein